MKRGLTLLEVLFAIGIVAIGIMGVAATIAVGLHRSADALIVDAAANVGRAAIHQFRVRGMDDRSENWAIIKPSVLPLPSPGTLYQDEPFAPPDAFVSYADAGIVAGESICIDPLFLGCHVSKWRRNEGDLTPEMIRFPYYTSGVPTMRRITLRNYPGAVKSPWVPPMTFCHAGQFFAGRNDLIFEEPKDKTLPPKQVYANGHRDANEHYTWMAMVTPQAGADADQYTLYVVVFHKRDRTFAIDQQSERVCLINDTVTGAGSQFFSRGYGGGEVQIETRAGQPHTDLDVSAGQWIMLAWQESGKPAVFRWYQVNECDNTTGAGPYTRNLSLHGPDWSDVIAAGRNASPPQLVHYAVLLDGVVAVYERSVRVR